MNSSNGAADSESVSVGPNESAAAPAPHTPKRIVRIAIAGVLMGTANLIPGVSGGTMVLAMGLYQEFIDAVADLTAFRFSLRRIVFIAILGLFALGAIVGLAGVILYLLFHYPVAMYALFIGLTLGGAPTLISALRPVRADVIIATLVGLALMIGVLLLKFVQGGAFPHNSVMDVCSGIIGATTMVLPGVSGSYMLAVMDQYGRIVGAVDERDFAIIIPVACGAVAGIVGLAHLLKILLHRYQRPTVGVLLGILLGSVIGLWPFGKPYEEKILSRADIGDLVELAERWGIPDVHADMTQAELVSTIRDNWDERTAPTHTAGNVLRAGLLVVIGFIVTAALARMKAGAPPPPAT